jgi:hypothetical protein
MSKTIAEAIAEIQESISAKDAEINALKSRVNILCEADGQSPLYPDVPQPGQSTSKSRVLKLRPDEFTADKLMKAMKRYLEMRKDTTPENAPAKPDEIAKALVDGGFDFKGKDPQAAVSTSLGKSSHTFKRFDGSGLFGLHTWYGGRPRVPSTTIRDNATASAAEDEDDDVNEEELRDEANATKGGDDK